MSSGPCLETFRLEYFVHPCNVRSMPRVRHSYPLSRSALWRANDVILKLIYCMFSVNIYYAARRTNCITFSMCTNDL